MSRNNLIQFRKGTFADFTGVNPVLASGEPGYAIDTRTLKVGDGTTPWNSLGALSGLGIENVVEDSTPQLGGNLDLNSNSIRGSGNISVIGNVDVTGNLDIDGNGTFQRVGIGTDGPTVGLQVEQNNITFNDGGGNFDFRVEGDTDPNLLFTDGSTDRVGIGTNNPENKLDVSGVVRASGYSVPAQSGFLKANATVDNNIYATTGLLNIVSGILQTNISTTSGVLQTNINNVTFVSGVTYNSSTHSLVLARNSGSSVTGVLSNIIHSGDNVSFLANDSNYATTGQLNIVSGILQSSIAAASGALINNINAVSGVLQTNINRVPYVSGVTYNSATHSLLLSRNSGSNITGILTNVAHSGDNISIFANDVPYLPTGDLNTTLQAGTGISVVYDSGNRTLTFNTDTSVFVTGISYNSGTHSLVLSRNSGSVTGVLNGIIHSGDNVSTLANDTGYITTGVFNTNLQAGTGISLVFNSGDNTLTFNTDTSVFVTGVSYNSGTHSLVLSRNSGSVTGVLNGIIHSGDNVSFLNNDTGYITSLIQDTSPQLGGNLDLNSNDITGTGDFNIIGSGIITETMDNHCGFIIKSSGNTNGELHVGSCSDSAGVGSAMGLRHSSMDGVNDYMIMANTDGATFVSAKDTKTLTLSAGGHDADTKLELRDVSGPNAGFRFNVNKSNVDLQYNGDNENNVFYIDASEDSVGVGTNTPRTRLDVSGTITASGGNSTQWNTAYGWGDHSTSGYLTAHPSTDAISSIDNSGRTYIQDLLLDSFGHITGVTSATETVVDTNTEYTAGTGLALNGTEFNISGVSVSLLNGIIDSSNLPSYVDDVLEYNGTGNFPASGTTSIIYIDTSGNDTYRWGGSSYVELTDDTAVWGQIGGTLSNQTDVYNAINAKAASGNNVSIFVNDVPYAISGTHISITNAASNVNNSSNDFVQDLLFDQFGHVTGVVSQTVTDNDVNTFVTGITYNSATHSLVLDRNAGSVTGVLNNIIHSGDNISFLTNDASYATTGLVNAVSGVLQAQIDTVDTDTFATGLIFNSGNNNLVLTRNDNVSITGNLQGVLVSGTTYHTSISAASSSNNAGRTYIQDVLLDTHGHVTGLATASETVTDTNTFATGIVFNTGDKTLVLNRSGGSVTGTLTNVLVSGNNVSLLNNDTGYLTAHPNITSVSSSDNSGRTYIQDLLLDSNGHVTGIATATETVVDTNDNVFVTGISYNSSTHSLVLSRNSGSVTGILDGVIHSGDNVSFLANDAGYLTGHPNITSVSSSDNSGRTYIQDILLDSNGHVTGLATATETVTDTNTEYTAGTGLELSGSTQFNIDSTVLTTGNLIAGTGLNFNSVAKRLDIDSTVLTTGSSISSLSNVNLSAPVGSDQILKYDGGNFVNTDLGLNLMKRGSIPFGGYSTDQMGHYFFFDGSSEAVINTDGDDINFRVEGSGGTNLLFTDGGTQKVGIGTNTPSYTLDVVGSGSFDVLNINNAFTFPTGDGTAGHSLVTDGAGNIIFSGVTSGGGGDITAVTAGTGLSGGGTTGAVTLNAVSATTSVTGIVKLTNTINGDQDKALTPKAVNDAGYLTAHPNITSVSSSNNSGRTYIQDILLDSNGHVTGIATAAETVTDTNTFTTGIVFNTGNKSLVLNRDGGSVTGTLTNVLVTGENISLLNNDAGYLTTFTAAFNNTTAQFVINDQVPTLFGGKLTTDGSAVSEMVVNDGGAAFDFRVEGDTDANLLFVDGSADSIGIGIASPAHKLDVVYPDSGCVRFADPAGSGIMIGDCALSSNATYAGMQHTKMVGSYMMVSNGDDTYISARDTQSVFIRGGGNDANSEISIHDVGIGGVGIVFNEQGADRDIRMEGASDVNVFRLDASADSIGIGTATPAYKLDVAGSGSFNALNINDAYTFPTGDGTAGHSLVTDGAGNIIFSGVTGGTTHTAGTGLALDGTRFNLTNTSVNYGGVSVALGASDVTPAFNLVDATGYPTSSLVGTITNDQLAGSIANSKLSNSSVNYGGISVSLGASDVTPAFNLVDATGYLTSNLVGTITNAQLAGSIANNKLANSAVTITAGTGLTNGGAVSLGGSVHVDIDETVLTTGALDTRLQAGSGVTLVYSSGDNTLTINNTANTTLGTITVTSSQTVFNTTDTFSSGNLAVFVNGVKLVDGNDFSIPSASGFTLTSAAASGDIVDYIAYGSTVASTNLQKTGDTMTGNLAVNADLIVTGYKETHLDNGNTGSSQTISITGSTFQTYTLNNNCTFTLPAADAGRSFTVLLKTGGAGYTASFSGVKFPSNSAPTVTASGSRLDVFTFISDGTNWYGDSQQDYHL